MGFAGILGAAIGSKSLKKAASTLNKFKESQQNSSFNVDNNKPVATDHTHEKNKDMINPNKFANQKIQELGKSLFQGEEMAQQMANKQLDQPVPPPGSYGDMFMNPIMNKESREAKRQERKSIREANKGLRQARRERAKGVKEQGQENYSYDGYEKGRYDKKGDDIEYGKVKRYSKKNPPLNKGVKKIVKDKKSYNEVLAPQDPDSLVTKAKVQKIYKK